MHTTIDAAGRLVIPKALRDELGFVAGMELELDAVDGRLEVAAPSRTRVEEGPHGIRFTAAGAGQLGVDEVRRLVERGRR
jgi:AbrB family looped-hinge helix DNA binding protein